MKHEEFPPTVYAYIKAKVVCTKRRKKSKKENITPKLKNGLLAIGT
jgi:hypothetical protein